MLARGGELLAKSANYPVDQPTCPRQQPANEIGGGSFLLTYMRPKRPPKQFTALTPLISQLTGLVESTKIDLQNGEKCPDSQFFFGASHRFFFTPSLLPVQLNSPESTAPPPPEPSLQGNTLWVWKP